MPGIHGIRIASPVARVAVRPGGRRFDGDGNPWHRYRRLGPDTVFALRYDRTQADLRPHQPRWRLSAVQLSGSSGVLTKNARDAALVLRAIAGTDSRDPASAHRQVPDYSQGLEDSIRGIRVGCLRGFFAEDLSDDVKSAVETAVGHLLDLGAQVEELSLPLMNHVPGTSLAIMTAESYAVHEHFLRERAYEYGADVRLRLLMGAMVSASQYLKAQRFRRLLCEQTAQAMNRFDVLVAPTTPIAATPIGQEVITLGNRQIAVGTSLSRLTRPANMMGLPAISVRCGFSTEGLPLGFQIIGRPFEEATILRVAHAYQTTTEWHRRRPL